MIVPPPLVGGVVILAVPPAEKPVTKVIPVGKISVRLTSNAGAEEVLGFLTVSVTKVLFPGNTSSGVKLLVTTICGSTTVTGLDCLVVLWRAPGVLELSHSNSAVFCKRTPSTLDTSLITIVR